MDTLTYLKGRRLWVVRDVIAWGLASDASLYFLGEEDVDSTGRLLFGMATIGGEAQDIQFSDLVDYRGNALPSSIDSPRVLIRPRSSYLAYIVGEESNTGFKIARDSSAPGPVSVDFFIYEMGG
jgi:hypothetical protein